MKRTLTLVFLGSLAATSLALAQPGGGAAGSGPEGTRGPRGATHFEKLDADGNGSVSLSEMKTAMRTHLGEADTNKDGKITADEMRAHHEARRAEWKAKRGAAGPEGEVRGKGKHHGGKGKHFARIDTNGDGVVTRSEIDAAASERFARLDANKDKKLTPDEMKRHHGRGHGRRGHCDKES